jgi:hypothetical protein
MPRVRQANGNKAFSSTANNAGKKRTLKRSSRVIPGFRGTPAGMTTTLAPVRASPKPWLDLGGHDPGEGNDPDTLATVGICWSGRPHKMPEPRRGMRRKTRGNKA